MNQYKTIIYGATFFGIGIALQDPKNTLILEPSSLVGSEFIDAYRFDGMIKNECLGDYSKELCDTLKKYEIEDESGYVFMPSLYVPFMEFIMKNKINIAFDSSIIAVSQELNSVNIECVSRSQIEEYVSSRFIDTTSKREEGKKVTLNSLFLGEYQPYTKNGFTSVDIGKQDCFVVEMEVPQSMSNVESRKRILEFIRKLPIELTGSKLLMVSNSFCIRCESEERKDGNVCFIPSSKYRNFYEALDKGVGYIW